MIGSLVQGMLSLVATNIITNMVLVLKGNYFCVLDFFNSIISET